MTMEERSSGIEDGAPVISTGASINTSHSPNNSKTKACELTTDASYPIQRTSKRSFDVAFLVAPDEKMLKRQNEKLTSNFHFTSSRVAPQDRAQISEDVYNDDSREYEQNDRIPQNMTIKHFESIEAASKYKARRAEDVQTTIPPYISPKRRLTPTSAGLSLEPPAQLYAVQNLRAQKTPSPPNAYQRSPPARKVFIEENSNDQSLPLPTSRAKSNCDSISCPDSRSAFTKVNLTVQRNSLIGVSPSSSSVNFDENTTSPRSSVSPDVISYQNSLSPPILSPAAAAAAANPSNVSAFNPKYSASFPTKMPYPFLISPEAQQTTILDNLKLSQQLTSQASAAPPKVPSPKMPAAGFGTELTSAVYPNLPYNPLTAVFPPIGDALARPRFLAASLLPSSLAALALPAQNVCAKCNLSFRMTSDLVYHMRSHHKNENSGEAARRRREEKLRCPVCDESFRERHHLTRHMTAHQDKESDAIVDQVDVKRQAAAAAAAATLVHGK